MITLSRKIITFLLMFFILWKHLEGVSAMQGKRTYWTLTTSFLSVFVYGKDTLKVVGQLTDTSSTISPLSC